MMTPCFRRGAATASLWLLLIAGGAAKLSAQATEWTRTVAPGVVRADVDVVARGLDRDLPAGWGGRVDTVAWGYTDLTVGVAEGWEVRVGGTAWVREEWDGWRRQGMGDLNLSFKWTMAGDEAEGVAWALMPFVKLPTTDGRFSDPAVDGGAMVIFGCPLGEAGWVNAQFGADDAGDGAGGRDTGLFGSLVAGRAVGERWTVYAETLAARYPWNRGGDTLTLELGGGVTWSGDEAGSWGLDLAGYGGLTRAATDVQAVLRLWKEWGAGR